MRFNSKHLVQIALIAAGVVLLITGHEVAAIWMFILLVFCT